MGNFDEVLPNASEYLHAKDLGGISFGAASSKSRILMIDPRVGFFSLGMPSGGLFLASSSASGKGPETGPR